MSTEQSTLAVLDAPELGAIEKSRAEQIRKTFVPMAQTLKEFEAAYDEVIEAAAEEITGEVTAAAKRVRLNIAKVRIATEKARKAEKEEYLRAGKAIDSVSNILKWAVQGKEKRLKDIEDHFEIKEQKQLDAIRAARQSELLPYVDDSNIAGLADMPDDVWDAYLAAKKKEHADRIAAERVAEEARVAKEKEEAAERQRIEAENAKLKKEAAAREKRAKAEKKTREAAEAKRKKAEAKKEAERKAKEKAEREKREAEERDREAARESERKVEQKKREKLEADLRAKEEADQNQIDAEEADLQAVLNQGDAPKLKRLAGDIETIRDGYSFRSAKNKKRFGRIGDLLAEAIQITKE